MKKHFFDKISAGKRTGKAVHNPDTAGRLVDLYHAHQQGDSVIGHYILSNPHLSLEEIEDLLKLEKALRLAEANKLYRELNLPPWKKLAPELKQAYKTAACGLEANGVALSCNLGWIVASKALANPEAAARMIGRKVRAVLAKLGLPLSLAITLEFAGGRANNPELHFHGAFSVPDELKETVWNELRKALAHDYIATGNKPVWTVPIREPGGWEAYTLKNLNKTLTRIDRPFYATHEASRLGEKLYEKIRQWLKGDPKGYSEDAFRKVIPACISPRADKLIELIEVQKKNKKELRAASRGRTIEMKKRAKADPAAFHKELAETFWGVGAEWKFDDYVIIDPVDDSDVLSSSRLMPLKEKYRDNPSAGLWETVGEDVETDEGH